VPSAGIACGGVVTTRSGGSASDHVSGQRRRGGASRGSPATAPSFAHATIADSVASSSERSLAKRPIDRSACHGGIRRCATHTPRAGREEDLDDG